MNLEVTSADITVVIKPDYKEDFYQGFYRFCCPECRSIVVKEVDDPRIIELLIASNANYEFIDPSPELDEEVRKETSQPTEDEIIDYVRAVRRSPSVVGLIMGKDPEELLGLYREHRDTLELDDHLNALRDLFETYEIEGEDLFAEIKTRYLEGLELPPEGDNRFDGPAGDINNV
jgi:hypothetical protein